MSSVPWWMMAAVMAAAVTGCTVETRTRQPVGTAELYYGGVYRYYPHTVYQGRDVYYVDNRWMYRDGDVWRYYETEPLVLYRYRTTVRQAPPAPRENAPRVYQPAQPVPTPSPALPERVR